MTAIDAARSAERAEADHARPGAPVEITPAPIDASEILALRRGPGANCSSIGSTLDVLFLSATIAGAILAVAAAAFGDDGRPREEKSGAPREGDEDDARAG